MSMEAPKLAYVIALALMLFGCQILGMCRIGDEAGCTEGAFCYAGKNAKAGDVGVCTQILPGNGEFPEEDGELPEEEGGEEEEEGFTTERLRCSAQTEGLLENAVTQPLVIAGRHLVFASSVGQGATRENNSLYFFDTAHCELHSSVYVGAVTGPMVALGGSGRIAIAVGRGSLPEENTSHLHLVDSRALVANTNTPTIDGSYEHGLSLLSIGDAEGTSEEWFFVASKYARNWSTGEYGGYLTAYFPNKPGDNVMERVRDSSRYAHRFRAPVSQIQRASAPDTLRVLTYAGSFVGGFYQTHWNFGLFGQSAWTDFSPTQVLGHPFWMAIAGEEAWVNALMSPAASPAVIDNQHRVYAVDTPTDDGWRLQRFAWGVGTADVWSPFFQEAPVGSPLLGEPVPEGAAEVYVVTEKGTVLAFDAESLELLWRAALRMEVSRGAQPVLENRRLWVVGMQGQVRALRVESTGLNRRAHWPKAFGDNCNTSSKRVGPSNMPSCF